jgi:ABC-type phosphate transport system permease subunit
MGMTRATAIGRGAFPRVPLGGLAAWASGLIVVGTTATLCASLIVGGWSERSAVNSVGAFGWELQASAYVVTCSFLLVIAIAFFAAVAAAETAIGGQTGRWLNLSLRVGPAMPAVVVAAAALTALVLPRGAADWYLRHPLPATVLALSALNLPIMTARFRLVLRSVPRRWRVAAIAAGASPQTALLRVAIPCAKPGIIAAALTGFGQMLGETVVVVALLAGFSGVKPVAASLWAALASSAPIPSGVAVQVLLLVTLVLVLRLGAHALHRRRLRAQR